MMFIGILCKNSGNEFFVKKGSMEKGVNCPHCGTVIKVDVKIDEGETSMWAFRFNDPSKKHKPVRDVSREEAIKCAIQSKKTVSLESEQGRFISFLEFLAEQPEFKKN